MATGLLCTLLLAVVISVTHGMTMEPSIAHSVFLPRDFDPFCDTYVETVTRMSANEIMNVPHLNDTEFIDQLTRGIDSVLISKTRAGSNNLFNPNLDEQIQHQGDIDSEWEDLMVGGPASINYMGAVMAIASRKDFPLKPDFVYKLVKYPNSYHATLVQVSNDMYRALSGAHTSMEKIQSNMRQIPGQIKTALKLITQASISMTKSMLPRTLANIGRYANESADVARSSLERFDTLRSLLEEIVEASTLTNKDNRETAEQLAKEAEELKKQKEAMDAAVANIKAQYEIARQDLDKARQDYHTAMLNVPGGEWNAAAWNVYASHRPAQTCSGRWFWRNCRSLRDEQFAQYSHEARQKAQEALNLLKKAEERSKELLDKQLDKQDEVGTAITNLAMIDFNEISINQTITILLDATRKIALVQDQWSRITRFFSKLAITTEHTQQVTLENFIGAINDADIIGKPLDPSDKTLFTMMLVETATDIDRDTHLLFLMAKTYTDVSNEYMVDQIAGLSGLLTLQTNAERDAYVKEVADKAKETSIKIRNLAIERQEKYELASFDRQEQYMKFIEQAMIQEELDLLGGIGIGRR